MSAARFTLVHPDTGEEIILPGRFVVCTRCRGEGAHVNPSIDGNGISPQEFAEDTDFAESYFAGDYDVPCETCRGARVVAVPDLTRWTFAQKRLLVRDRQAERESQRDYDSERWLRMAESGERW